MPQHLAAVTLLVREYDEAIEFFTRALRLRLVEDTPVGDGKRWVLMATGADDSGGRGCGLLLARAATPEQHAQLGRQAGGRVALFLHTDDFEGLVAHMRAQGVRFTEAPRDEPYGKVVVFEDLYGNRWDLVQPARRPEST
jgi:catechol 2,3-dioxygenase-like lactoylglutathione lyase family enzyme